MSNEFWVFSLATYGRAGVADNALLAQDELGLDINLVLYAAWLASQDLQLTTEHLADLDSAIASWRGRVIVPLRALRQQLRDYPAAEEIRGELKSLELRAEQHQQDLMWDFFQAADGLQTAVLPLEPNLGLLVGSPDAGLVCWQSLLAALGEAIRG